MMVTLLVCQIWLLKWSAGCPAGTDKDVSSTYKQQCEAVLVQKRCAFSVLGDDEAMEGIPEQIVVACHYAQYYCLFPQHWCVCVLCMIMSCNMSTARLNAG